MPLELAVFDFDLTLSKEHVFNLIASGIPAATTEAGQLSRISELDMEYDSPGGFARAMFGGPSRISELQEMLRTLRNCGVDCVVCTKGLVGPVRKLLQQAQLLKLFSGVYGNTQDKYGQSLYDMTANPGNDIRFVGGPECQIQGTKQQFVQDRMHEQGLTFDDVVFIDDMLDEILSMQRTCQAIHVTAKGIDRQTIHQLYQLMNEVQWSLADKDAFVPMCDFGTVFTKQPCTLQ